MTNLQPISKPDWRSTISEARFTELILSPEKFPTPEEIGNGWHFCWELDGIIANAFDPENRNYGCRCMDVYFADKGQRIVDEI